MNNLFEELTWRGMVYDATEGLAEILAKEQVTAYVGFDPTASSLHVGSMLPVMALRRLQRHGHKPIAIVGGGTGMIGDPSVKNQERVLLSADQVEANLAGIKTQLSSFLDFEGSAQRVQPAKPGMAIQPALIVNNAEWLGIDLMSFLRDVGKHFTVNYMLQKESVSRRLESEEGISYTEFSYLVMQAYDFLQLFDRGCTVQLGGSDQWGNITAGIDLIRKLRSKKAHGLVWPLMKTASGAKFGKTEAGTIWLDSKRTSPFKFYQFWVNTDDRDVETYFKYFSNRTQLEIEAVMREFPPDADARYRQRILATELTELVHGEEQAQRAIKASDLLFTELITGLPVEDVLSIFEDVPSTDLQATEVDSSGIGIVDLIARVGLAPSKSEARRLVQSGGVYVNNKRITDPQSKVTREMAIGGRVFVLRKGQKQNHLARLA